MAIFELSIRVAIYLFVVSSIRKVLGNLYIHQTNVNLKFFEESANSDRGITKL